VSTGSWRDRLVDLTFVANLQLHHWEASKVLSERTKITSTCASVPGGTIAAHPRCRTDGTPARNLARSPRRSAADRKGWSENSTTITSTCSNRWPAPAMTSSSNPWPSHFRRVRPFGMSRPSSGTTAPLTARLKYVSSGLLLGRNEDPPGPLRHEKRQIHVRGGEALDAQAHDREGHDEEDMISAGTEFLSAARGCACQTTPSSGASRRISSMTGEQRPSSVSVVRVGDFGSLPWLPALIGQGRRFARRACRWIRFMTHRTRRTSLGELGEGVEVGLVAPGSIGTSSGRRDSWKDRNSISWKPMWLATRRSSSRE
jgi:hypothetical protein